MGPSSSGLESNVQIYSLVKIIELYKFQLRP